MTDAASVAEKLLYHLMVCTDKWLDVEANAEVVIDDPEEEAVVTSGGKRNGHGHVTMNFYFKTKQ